MSASCSVRTIALNSGTCEPSAPAELYSLWGAKNPIEL
jgi:hypothetical protein